MWAMLLSTLSAEVLETWTFSEADGSEMDATYSDNGSVLSSATRPTAAVRDGKMEFFSDGATDGVFLINGFAGMPMSSGVYEVCWTYTSAAFVNTLEVGGSANLGFDFRNTMSTRYKGNDDERLGGVRMRYENKTIQIQYQVAYEARFTTIASIDRIVLPDPLRVRIRYDLDHAGQPGSMQVFLKLGEEDEINPVTDAKIPEGSILNGYRILQQITNGKTNWQLEMLLPLMILLCRKPSNASPPLLYPDYYACPILTAHYFYICRYFRAGSSECALYRD
jgi:hypothetical protein